MPMPAFSITAATQASSASCVASTRVEPASSAWRIT
jgi:hypothetical protein